MIIINNQWSDDKEERQGYIKCQGCWQNRKMEDVKLITFHDGEQIESELECLNPDWGVMVSHEKIDEPDYLD